MSVGLAAKFLNEAVDLFEVGESEFIERTETAVLSGKGVIGHPSAGELVEIILRHGCRVQIRERYARGLGGLLTTSGHQ